jgi:hypothetical protein
MAKMLRTSSFFLAVVLGVVASAACNSLWNIHGGSSMGGSGGTASTTQTGGSSSSSGAGGATCVTNDPYSVMGTFSWASPGGTANIAAGSYPDVNGYVNGQGYAGGVSQIYFSDEGPQGSGICRIELNIAFTGPNGPPASNTAYPIVDGTDCSGDLNARYNTQNAACIQLLAYPPGDADCASPLTFASVDGMGTLFVDSVTPGGSNPTVAFHTVGAQDAGTAVVLQGEADGGAAGTLNFIAQMTAQCFTGL